MIRRYLKGEEKIKVDIVGGGIAGAYIAKNRVNKYPHIINQDFIKWDLIGKTFIKVNSYLRNINPKLVLASMN